MKSNINRHTAALKKLIGVSLVLAFGLVGFFPQTADARLLFTTEDDGVNSDAYHLDNDDSSADFIDLGFGTGLGSRLRYDIVGSQFLLNQDFNLEGNALEDFRIENAAAALACAAPADKGRMYYNTTSDDLFFCDGASWISTSTSAAGLAGAGLVVNGTELDVNVDDSTIEINADVVRVKDLGITEAKLAADAVTTGKIAAGAVELSDLAGDSVNSAKIVNESILSADILNGTISADDLGTDSVDSDEIAASAVGTAEIANTAVTVAKIGTVGAGDALKFLTTDAAGNAQWELKSNFMSSSLASANMWVGNAGGTATAVTMSGDATMDNTGALTIANDAVNSTKIDDGTIATVDIAAGAITGGAAGVIADNSITADDINTGAVTTDEILDGTIGTNDLNATGAGNNKTLTTDAGGAMVWVDDAAVTREVSAHVAPEFSNFTLATSGANGHKGSLESDHADNRNFYKWKTRKTGAMQDYDVVFQWMVPDDFQSWSTTANPIEVDYKTDTTVATDNKLDITMNDTANAAVTLDGTASGIVSAVADTWATAIVDSSIAAGTFTPGEYVTITVKMSSKATTTANKNPAYLGAFTFNYVAK
jgi:hypothetical protein